MKSRAAWEGTEYRRRACWCRMVAGSAGTVLSTAAAARRPAQLQKTRPRPPRHSPTQRQVFLATPRPRCDGSRAHHALPACGGRIAHDTFASFTLWPGGCVHYHLHVHRRAGLFPLCATRPLIERPSTAPVTQRGQNTQKHPARGREWSYARHTSSKLSSLGTSFAQSGQPAG
jgi:hypothetical protein